MRDKGQWVSPLQCASGTQKGKGGGGEGLRRKSLRWHCGAGRNVSGLMAISKFKCPLTGVPHPPAMGLKEFPRWASLLAACSLGGAWPQCRWAKDPEGSSQCCETLMFLATGSLEGALAGAPLWPSLTHYTESSLPLSSKHFISSS